MLQQTIKIKANTIRWHQFSRRSDAVFLSLGREINIGVLSVATLLAATPDSATARVSMAPVHADEATELLDEGVAAASGADALCAQVARRELARPKRRCHSCRAAWFCRRDDEVEGS